MGRGERNLPFFIFVRSECVGTAALGCPRGEAPARSCLFECTNGIEASCAHMDSRGGCPYVRFALAEETDFRIPVNHRASDDQYDDHNNEFHSCPHIKQPAPSLRPLPEKASYSSASEREEHGIRDRIFGSTLSRKSRCQGPQKSRR